MKTFYPVFFMLWSFGCVFSGMYMAKSIMQQHIASNSAWIDSSMIPEKYHGEYMCLKIHKLEEPK